MLMWDDNNEGLLKTEGKVWRTYLAFISSVCSNVVRPNNKQICLMKREITLLKVNLKNRVSWIVYRKSNDESRFTIHDKRLTMRNIAFHRQPVRNGACECHFVGKFQFSAKGNTPGNGGDFHGIGGQFFLDI